MLDYCKLILQKVSFDNVLFEKELIKSFNYLRPEEIKDLILWAQTNFGDHVTEIISRMDNFM
jgi:hypothetical protein